MSILISFLRNFEIIPLYMDAANVLIVGHHLATVNLAFLKVVKPDDMGLSVFCHSCVKSSHVGWLKLLGNLCMVWRL